MNEDKVRKRQSYVFWKGLVKFLNRKPKTKTVLKKIHDIIDDKRGYGSETNSFYSKESLELLIKDEGIR